MGRLVTLALLCWVLAQILIVQAAAHSPNSSDGAVSEVAGEPLSSYAESSSDSSSASAAEAPGIRRMGKHRSDKSVAGGGVIIGGLVTAIFAAVFCYIRVTRKRGGVQ